MKKKTFFIILLIIIIIAIGAYFFTNREKEESREYQIENIEKYNYFVSESDGKFGVINDKGETVIDNSYNKVEIPNPSRDIFICYTSDNTAKVLNSNNQQLFTDYDSVEGINLKNVAYDLPYEKSVLKCKKGDKYGLIDFDGNKLLDTIYDDITDFENVEGELKIQKDNKVGIANIKGTILVEPIYDDVLCDNYYDNNTKYQYSGFIVGNKNDDGFQYGYIDYKGNLTSKIEYNDISRVTDINNSDGTYLIAAKNGQYGLIKNDKNIINNEYQSIDYDSTTGVFVLGKGKNYGVANTSGKIIIPVQNSSIQVKGQYIYAEKDNDKKVYDSNGKTVDIDFNRSIVPTSNNNYKLTIDTKDDGDYYGVIDANNTQIVGPDYLYIEYLFNNYFIACAQDGKLGVIDDKGNAVIDLKYDLVQKVQDKNIVQTLSSATNTTELYSSDMQQICSMQNATVETKNDFIKVYSNTDLKYFNSDGKEVTSQEVYPNNSLFLSVKDNMWGYVDKSGAVKVDYAYEKATEFNDQGFAAVELGGKWGAIDSTGKVIVEPKYDANVNYGDIDFIGEYIKTQNESGDTYYTK